MSFCSFPVKRFKVKACTKKALIKDGKGSSFNLERYFFLLFSLFCRLHNVLKGAYAHAVTKWGKLQHVCSGLVALKKKGGGALALYHYFFHSKQDVFLLLKKGFGAFQHVYGENIKFHLNLMGFDFTGRDAVATSFVYAIPCLLAGVP